ncbi:hypothetical protein RUND412_003081 [Rhizina undulata]
MASLTESRAETKAQFSSEIAIFFRRNRSQAIHIEYVPSPAQGEPKLLIEGPNIGIPKPLLLQDFVSARRTFFSLLASRQYPAWEIAEQEQLLDSSLILLLVGSEHLTAVNTRKKIVLLRRDNLVMPREEVTLLTGILTSPLNKHNKSPLLWDYRRWLAEKFGMNILAEGLHGEMQVVRKAGEVHPRNYYAWNYARFITCHHFKTESVPISTLYDIVNDHVKFCEHHVSDTSAWSFLFFLFSLWKSRGDHDREFLAVVISNVLDLTVIAPGHESIWNFLRSVLANDGMLQERQREAFIRGVGEKLEKENGIGGSEENKGEREFEERALRWIRNCENKICKSSS